MRFVIDAQLPAALAHWITSRGHEAEHVEACGLLRASDAAIWRYAADTGAAIVTKDEDFARRRIVRAAGPPVVWLRVGNTRTRELLALLERLFPHIEEALDRGEGLIEVLDRLPPSS